MFTPPLERIRREVRAGRQEARRLAAQTPRARFERRVAQTPAARRGRMVRREERRRAQERLRRSLADLTPPMVRAQRQADRRVRRALRRLPNPPRLYRAPIKASYTEREKTVILREQSRRIQEMARRLGVSPSEVARFVRRDDLPQLALFAELAGERQARALRGLERGRRMARFELRRRGLSDRDVDEMLAPQRARPWEPGMSARPRPGGLAGVLWDVIGGESSPLPYVRRLLEGQSALPDPRDVAFAMGAPGEYLRRPGARRDTDLAALAGIHRLLTGASRAGRQAYDRLNPERPDGLLAAGLPDEIARNIVRDALDIPAEAIPSVYYPASLAAAGQWGEAGRVLVDPYRELVENPGRMLREHPLASALMTVGVVSPASRAVGAAGRRLGVRAFDTERGRSYVPHTGLEELHFYSRDPLVKAVQVAGERLRERRRVRLRREAGRAMVRAWRYPADAERWLTLASDKRDLAGRLDPSRMREGYLFRQGGIVAAVDAIEGRNIAWDRVSRAQFREVERLARRYSRSAGVAVSMIAQSVVHPSPRGLQAYRDALRFESRFLSRGERVAARKTIDLLNRSIRNAERGRYDPAALRAELEQIYAPVLRRLEREAHEAGILPAAQAERAALIPPAVRFAGGRHDPRRAVTEEGQLRWERAKQRSRAAREELRLARQEVRRAESFARMMERRLASQRVREGAMRGRVEMLGRDRMRDLSDAELVELARGGNRRLARQAERELAWRRQQERLAEVEGRPRPRWGRRLDVDEVAARVAEARRAERRAAGRLEAAQRAVVHGARREGRAEGRAEVLVAQSQRRAARLLPRAREVLGRTEARLALARERGASGEQLRRLERRVEGARLSIRRLEQMAEGRRPVRSLRALERAQWGQWLREAELRVARDGVERARAARRAAEEELRVARRQQQLGGLERARGGLLEVERAVSRARQRVQDARGRLREAQRAYVAARREQRRERPRRFVTGLVGPDGRRLSNEEIRAAMAREGVPEPLFVTQKPRRGSLASFYRHWGRQAPSRWVARTGSGTRKGTVDYGPWGLVETVNRLQGLLNADRGWGHFVNVTALRRDDGRLFSVRTLRDAERAKADLEQLPGGFEWQIIQLNPWKGRQQDADGVVRLTEPSGQPSARVRDILVEALEASGDGPYGLVPKAAADRMQAHLKVLGQGPLSRLYRAVTGAFARVVLTTSTSWMAGNAIEGQFRAAVSRATPFDALVALRVFREMGRVDRDAAFYARVAGRPGGHMGYHARQVRLVADHFNAANPALGRAARAFSDLLESPVPRTLADAWGAYTRGVFRLNEFLAEAYPQYALAGRYIRHRWGDGIRVSETAIRQAAEGLRGTAEQVAMARFVRETYGQYSSFTPGQRQVKAWMPFFAWAHNAARFLYVVLPRDHPALTGLLAAVNIGSKEWLERHGLARSAPNAAPGFLLGSVPVAGGLVRASRHLPFALATDPVGTFADLLMPQFSSALEAMQGRDWRGRPLKNQDGSPYRAEQRAAYAAKQFFLGVTPFYARGDQFLNADGSFVQRLRAVVDPYRAVRRGGRAAAAAPAGAFDEALDRALSPGQVSERQRRLDEALDRALSGQGVSEAQRRLDEALDRAVGGG